MGLLPHAMRLPDLPLTLGRKVERPVPKKPDPISAFERGDHSPAAGFVGRSVPEMVDTEAERRAIREFMFGDFRFAVDPAMGPDTVAVGYRPRTVLAGGAKNFVEHIMRAEIEAAQLAALPPLVVRKADLAAEYNGRRASAVAAGDEPVSPRMQTMSEKMAEILQAKQELRRLQRSFKV
jgi:hypothetical protein